MSHRSKQQCVTLPGRAPPPDCIDGLTGPRENTGVGRQPRPIFTPARRPRRDIRTACNNRQHVHPRPYPQVTVHIRTWRSADVRACCGTFLLYCPAWPNHAPSRRMTVRAFRDVTAALSCAPGTRSGRKADEHPGSWPRLPAIPGAAHAVPVRAVCQDRLPVHDRSDME